MHNRVNEDGVLDKNLVNLDFYCLHQVIKQNTNDEKFILQVEKLKTDLPIIYIEYVDKLLFISLISYLLSYGHKDIETIFRIAIEHTYEINDPLLITHFLFKAVEEENNDLIKNKKPYRVDFGDDAGNHFIKETRAYWEIYNFYNDDGTLNHLELGRHMETLDLIITR